MSSTNDSRAYFQSIQSYFLERTGRGLMLSSRDLELMIGWCQSGVAMQVVCRGIDQAVDALREAPRDLHAIRRFVEPRVAPAAAPVFVEPRPEPVAQQDVWGVALETAVAARQQAGRPEIAASFLEVSRRIREASDAGADPWTVLYDLDDFVVRDVFERLSEDERRLIDLEIEGRHGAHLSMMNAETREQTMLESRRRALRDRWEIPSLAE